MYALLYGALARAEARARWRAWRSARGPGALIALLPLVLLVACSAPEEWPDDGDPGDPPTFGGHPSTRRSPGELSPTPDTPPEEALPDDPRPPRSPRRPRTGDVTDSGPARSSWLRETLDTLRGPDGAAATDLFWELAEVDRQHIPELISEVTNAQPSTVTRLKILVKDPNFQGFLASNIRGMGLMEEFDDEGRVVATHYADRLKVGVAKNRKGYEVVLDDPEGFPVGVVLRAALLNRFRSDQFPSGIDHTRELQRWWWEYYRVVFGA